MFMNKGGISAIVAVVLMVLITVSGVTIIWVAIIPMVTEGIEFDGLEGRVSIVANDGYTTYDTTQDVAIVQVKRDPDDGIMNRIKIIFSIDGESVTSIVPAPGSGQSKTYTFNFTGYGEPEGVGVAPIFVASSGQEKEGIVMADIIMPKTKINNVDTVNMLNLSQEYS